MNTNPSSANGSSMNPTGTNPSSRSHPAGGVNWQNRTVLVTGAEGFIGSALVDLLVEQGAKVRAFVHYKPYGEKGNLAHHLGSPQVEMVAGDVRDAGRVDDAVAGCDTVFHLAALIGIPYSYDAPGAYVATNVVGTENIAEACRRHSVRRLVHTSTSEVYGTARTAPISEQHPLQPQSPYSASKIGADMMALSHWHAFELPVTVVRPFNTYGPRQSARAVIPTILAQLHSGAREIRLGSLAPTRDFTYVTDTARGFLALAGLRPRTGGERQSGYGAGDIDRRPGERPDRGLRTTGRGRRRPGPAAPVRQRGPAAALGQLPRPRLGGLAARSLPDRGAEADLGVGRGAPSPLRGRPLPGLSGELTQNGPYGAVGVALSPTHSSRVNSRAHAPSTGSALTSARCTTAPATTSKIRSVCRAEASGSAS